MTSPSYAVFLDGVTSAEDILGDEHAIARAAARAINKVARKARTASSREIRGQVNFPARYLISGRKGTLEASSFARANSLDAMITGRYRPTSLARFVTGSTRKGLSVRVKPGRRVRAPKGAFLMDGKNGNRLVAVRLDPGQSVTYGKRISSTQWKDSRGRRYDILYGPSVSQVFRDVADDQLDSRADELMDEFWRLLDLEM